MWKRFILHVEQNLSTSYNCPRRSSRISGLKFRNSTADPCPPSPAGGAAPGVKSRSDLAIGPQHYCTYNCSSVNLHLICSIECSSYN